MKTLKNKKGVSLVELIAVIVIMGIIATVGGISVATIIDNSNKKARETAASDVLAAGKNFLQMDQDTATYYVSLTDLGTDVEKATAAKFDNEVYVVETKDHNFIITETQPTAQPDSPAESYTVTVSGVEVTYTPASGSFASA